MISKTKAKKILSNVDAKHNFILADGTHIKNVFELLNKLLSMDSSTYLHHVNDHKNDFANWVLHVLKDEDLYKELKRVKQRTVIYQKIKRRIHYLNSIPENKFDISELELKIKEPLKKAKKVKAKKVKKVKAKPVKKIKAKKIKAKPVKKVKAKKIKAKPIKKVKAKKIKAVKKLKIKAKPKKVKKIKAKPKKISKKESEARKKEVLEIMHHATKVKPKAKVSHRHKKNKYLEPHFDDYVKATIAEFGMGIAVGLFIGLIMASYLL